MSDAGNRTLTLDGQAGDDTYSISQSGGIRNIAVNDSGALGFNELDINDPDNSDVGATKYTVDIGKIVCTGRTPKDPSAAPDDKLTVTYSNITDINVTGTNHGNTFTVPASQFGTYTTINGGAGHDSVTIAETALTLRAFAGVFTVNGGAQTTLLLDDRGITPDATFDVAAGLLTTYTPIASTYYVENTFVRRETATLIAGPNGLSETDNSAVGIYYSHLAELDVYDGAASTTAPNFNQFLVYGTTEAAQVNLRAQAPNDDIELGGVHTQIAVLPIADDVRNISITGTKTTTLAIRDQSTATRYNQYLDETFQPSVTYALNSGSISRTNVMKTYAGNTTFGGPIDSTTVQMNVTYTTLASLTVNGGRAGNTFNVAGTPANTVVTLNTGTGHNIIDAGGAVHLMRGIKTLAIHEQGDTILYLDDQANADTTTSNGTSTAVTTSRPKYLVTDQSVVRTDPVRTTSGAGIHVNLRHNDHVRHHRA